MTTTRSKVGRSQVRVDINDDQQRRVFVRFADADAKKRAQNVLDAAIEQAPVGKGPNAGALRRGLRMEQSRETSGQYTTGYDVVSTAPHTVFVIGGTRPHPIVGNPLLAFVWPKAGGFVVFRKVNHPGTKANNFLARALRAAKSNA